VVNHAFHAINTTLCPVNRSDASRVESQLEASETVATEGLDVGASLDIASFDSHGEMPTQVEGACPVAWPLGLQENQVRSAAEVRPRK
jgi:hypothetical protein